MKAAFRTRMGPPDVLTYGDLPDPEVGADTVLIRVHMISLEGGDLLNRRITPLARTPHVVGYQASGTIVALGASVTGLAIGQMVVGFGWDGSHAELFAVDRQHVYPLPDGMDPALGAMVPVAFGTASDALFEFAALKPGETVLIQGAAGGVGLAAVQLAHRAGARVLATASSASRLDALRAYGADAGINYRAEAISARVRDLTDGVGADVVVDLAGGKEVGELLKAVRWRGRFCVVGAASGLPAFQFRELLHSGATIHAILFGREMHTPRAHRLLAGLLQAVHKGELKMPVAGRFSLAQAAEAHDFAENAHPFGRVLIQP